MTEDNRSPTWVVAQDIPDWAVRRAFEDAGIFWEARWQLDCAAQSALTALARRIAKHEQPPVDRPTIVTRELLAVWFETDPSTGRVYQDNQTADYLRSGKYDALKAFVRARQYTVGILTGYADV